MTTNEILTLGVSLVSVIIAVTSLIRTRKVAAEQLCLSQEHLQLAEKQLQFDEIAAQLASKQIEQLENDEHEKRQPRFHVDVTKLGKSYHFLVANRGDGSAYNLNFALIDCTDSPVSPEEKFPVPELRSQARVKLLAGIHMGSPRKYHVRLTWDDSEGNQHSDDFHVTW